MVCETGHGAHPSRPDLGTCLVEPDGLGFGLIKIGLIRPSKNAGPVSMTSRAPWCRWAEGTAPGRAATRRHETAEHRLGNTNRLAARGKIRQRHFEVQKRCGAAGAMERCG